MALADLTVHVILSDLAVFLIVGGLAGLGTGYLMKSKRGMVLVDLLVGFVGGLVGAYLLVPAFGLQRDGLLGAAVLAIFGAILADVIVHFAVVMRHKAAAS
ncbi:MAG TPA: hypothetical protein VFU88_03230 [Ktedonobacterales bacterium]|nr:hypothetical protein [Ktedonobacterales bacterium]